MQNLNAPQDPSIDPSTGLPWGSAGVAPTQTGALTQNPDGTWTGPDGTIYPANPSGNTNPSTATLTQNPNGTLQDNLTTTQSAAPVDTGATPPPSSGAGGGSTSTGGSAINPGTLGSLINPPSYTAPTYVNPTYVAPNYPTAPTYPTLPTFQEPSMSDVQNMPGYQFGLNQGVSALDNSAAARGVSNTGGTLQDIIQYGDQYGTQNYQTARQNALADYQTNVAAQYLLPYQAAYNQWSVQNPQAAADAQSQTNFNTTNAGNQNSFNWNNAQQLYNVGRNAQTDAYNRLYGLASLGATVA